MTVDTRFLAKELRAATKADIQILRSDLGQVKAELEAKIEQLRSSLMIWFIGTNLTLAAIIIAVVKL